MDNVDQFVDGVYDELTKLFEKDKDAKKHLLGNDPLAKLFDNYSDWLANNASLSPSVAAHAIYRDVKGIGYIDFEKRKLKRGVNLAGETGFNIIYGTQKEIDAAQKLLNDLKEKDGDKYQVLIEVLTTLKQMSDNIKPQKNIYGGKVTNQSKETIKQFKQPTFSALNGALKMSVQELQAYLAKMKKLIGKTNG